MKWGLKMETSNINLFMDNTSFVWDPTFRQTQIYIEYELDGELQIRQAI